MTDGSSFRATLGTATRWSAFSELASRAISPIIYVILARVLSPEDFGVVAAAAIVVSFSQVIWDAGLSKALIQRKNSIEAAANVVFFTNIGLSVVVWGLLAALAAPLASLFQDARVADVVRVLGLNLVLLALCSVQTALFKRRLNFKALFWVRLITTTLPGLVSVPLAIAGLGYWALVVGTLLGSVGQAVVLWRASDWRPTFEYDREVARQLFKFGIWVTSEGLLAWFFMWFDAMIVGAFLGSRELGLFRTGNMLVLALYGIALGPITPVLYSALSRIQNDRKRVVAALLKAIRVTAVIALPSAVGIFLVSEPLAEVLLGPKWSGVNSVIGLMAVLHGTAHIFTLNMEAYRAVGRPDLSAKIMLLSLGFYLPAYLLAAPHGLHTFLWVRLFTSFVAIPIHLYIGSTFLGLGVLQLLRALRWTLLGTIAMAGMVLWATSYVELMAGPLQLGILITVGVVTFVPFLYPERAFVKDVLRMALSRGKPKTQAEE